MANFDVRKYWNGGDCLEKELVFAIEDVRHIDSDEYDSDDYMIARIKFASSRPNSHGIKISEDVLRESAKSVLGAWVTAEVAFGDATAHTDKQTICGVVPKEQDVEFVRADDGYLDAYVDCIISKRYAHDYCDIFSEYDNTRAVSIEALFEMEDEKTAKSFSVKTITTLGRNVKPSIPGADIVITRFSDEEAEKYYKLSRENTLSKLATFVEERKANMADEKYVSHPVGTSSDAVYTGEWDGDKARQDLIKEKKYKSLAPKVCLKLEDGWESREVTKLGYPVMGLYDGKWRYSAKALASAQAYAEQNNEVEVLNKIKAIRKELGLDETEGKEEAKMAKIDETKMDEIEGREAWAEIIKKVQEHEGDSAYVDSVEDDHIIYTKDDVRYRVDADIKVGDDDKYADAEIKWDTVKRDDDQKMSEDTQMSIDDALAEIERLKSEIGDRDHIIMDKDSELADLRDYKKAVMAKEIAAKVDAVMSDVKPYIGDDKFMAFREEGLACDLDTFDAWSNKVKAVCFAEVKKGVKRPEDSIVGFSMQISKDKKAQSTSVWDRIKENY